MNGAIASGCDVVSTGSRRSVSRVDADRRRFPPALPLFIAATSIGPLWSIGYAQSWWPWWTLPVLAALMVPAVPVFMAVRRRLKIRYWQAKGRRALERI